MLNQVTQGECLEVMQSLPDNSIDLILTDPPYFKVKADWWDRQWEQPDEFLRWIELLCEQWQRLLKPNGSLYCFASPKMASRVEVTISKHFNILNRIIWNKTDLPIGGAHRRANKESLRRFFPATESIIFAEHYGADHIAKGEAGYAAKCDELRGFVFEPLRAYLDEERQRSGVSSAQITQWFKERGLPKASHRHYFSKTQWTLPTRENYEYLRQCFQELAGGQYLEKGYEYLQQDYEYLKREYDYLRREYDELKAEYEALRRPFHVTPDVPYTDVWAFNTVFPRPGKHPCEKPLPLLEHIIQASSKPGAVVLDCFAGSGSTLVAAKNLDRQYIGIEIDEHWVSVSRERLGKWVPKSQNCSSNGCQPTGTQNRAAH